MPLSPVEARKIDSHKAKIRATVVRHPGGFGFLRTPGRKDLFVAPGQMHRFVPGDRVEVSWPEKGGRQEVDAAVRHARVIQRSDAIFVGFLRSANGVCVFEPEEPLGCSVTVAGEAAAEDELVAVRMNAKPLCGPDGRLAATIVARLGDARSHEAQKSAALLLGGFGQPCTQAVECEVSERLRDAALSLGPLHPPLDLDFVSIDKASVTDLDDAIHAELQPGGVCILRVAISDVAFRIPKGSALCRHARTAGTSLYFPDESHHMFPERLVTGLLSLDAALVGGRHPVVVHETRLDSTGRVDYRVFRAAIRSPRRLDYDAATGLLDKDATLAAIWKASQMVCPQRTDEPRSLVGVLLEKGVVRQNKKTRAHVMVESCMQAANLCAAAIMEQRGAGLFRVQGAPSPAKWRRVAEWAATNGIQLDSPEQPLSEVHEDTTRLALALRIASAMGSAMYSFNPGSGHFGVGARAYSHATSPIRRYSDLIVQRVLTADADAQISVSAQDALHCTDRVRAAAVAEKRILRHLSLDKLLSGTQRTHLGIGLGILPGTEDAQVFLPAYSLVARVRSCPAGLADRSDLVLREPRWDGKTLWARMA